MSEERHRRLLEFYDHYLDVGGLPGIAFEVVHGADFRKKQEAILAEYEQDFIRLFGEENIGIVNACFKSVAHFVGAPSKNTAVVPSPTAAINHKSNEVFARLEAWRLILKSPQKNPSPEKNYAYLPKRYLFDAGLLKYLRVGTSPSLHMRETEAPGLRDALGGILENQTAIEIARSGHELAGWKKTPSGGEIDFILGNYEQAHPLECKTTLKIKGSYLRGGLDYLRQYEFKNGLLGQRRAFPDHSSGRQTSDRQPAVLRRGENRGGCGWQGILRERALRFRHIADFSDQTEVHYALDLAASLVKPGGEFSRSEFLGKIRPFMAYRNNHQISNLGIRLYVPCFSLREDEPKQWEKYGDDGRGWALAFAPGPLCRNMRDRSQVYRFVRVVYDREAQTDIVRRYFQSCEEWYRGFLARFPQLRGNWRLQQRLIQWTALGVWTLAPAGRDIQIRRSEVRLNEKASICQSPTR